jgi:uncharacterized phage-associated protein
MKNNKYKTDISVLDVAAYIIKCLGEISSIKLWRLVFLCQVWYMVKNNGIPLFKEQFEAWINAPMVRELYNIVMPTIFRGSVWRVPCGKPERLDLKTKMLIFEVLRVYSRKSISDLVIGTTNILPWKIVRKSCDSMEACTNIISNDLIYDYYKDKQLDKLL